MKSESMPTIQAETFLKQIASGKTHPVYFFYGDEYYLMEETLKKATAKIVSKEVRDFNYDLLYGEEVTGDAVINIATSFPMIDRKSTRLNSSHIPLSRMPSSA